MNNMIFSEDIQVGDWQVWVEADPITNKPNIYVFGEAYGASLAFKPELIKISGSQSNQLLLELKHAVLSEEGFYTEVIFSEELIGDVDEIVICIGNQVILREAANELA